MNTTTCIRVGSITTGLGVALGAFGAHGLEATLTERGTTATWDTAVLYHLIHGLALVVCGLAASGRTRTIASRAFAIGVVVFSGSLYTLAVVGPKWLGAITPIGGVAFLVGWGALAWGAARRDTPATP